ncbi:MAG: DUF748 domain-containing protein [Bacteroidetes bacterium]|nr:DUF748 domain-containing protein [Bacteroidota bacterium]
MATDMELKHRRRPWRKIAYLLTGLLLLLGSTAYFLPWLLKRYIEKHSVEWINRKVSIDRITLNPFTFTYAVDGVKCFEPGSNDLFVSWRSISVRSDLWAGFKNNHWQFRDLRIRDPYFHIVQRGGHFNFSDLLELGGPDTAAATAPDTSSVRFSMENIQLTGGRVAYASDVLKAPISISGLNANCTRITSESARMDFNLHFEIDGGGEVGGTFKIDTQRSLYAVNADLLSFSLAPLLPYLQDFMHTTSLQGKLDLGLQLEDSWADTAALAASGNVALREFAVSDGTGAHLIGMKHGMVVLDTLNARNHVFKISRVNVDGLSTRFQQWADGSNTWTKALKLDSTETDSAGAVLAASPANIFVMLADYVRMLGQEFVANQYTADSLSVVNSSVQFEDFTPEKPFRYTLDQLAINSSRITTAAGTADFAASARLNGRGELRSTFKFDPKNFKNVEAEMEVKDLSLPDLDPYSRWYAAYPLTSGTLAYNGITTIRDGKIDSKNHMQADNLQFGKKTEVHDTGIYILPLRLGAALLKDVHGKIDLDIPVEGDLNDPTFKPWPIVWKVLKNLVVKAAAAPVNLVAGMLGNKDDANAEEVRFPQLGAAMGKEQRSALDALATLLKQKPELNAALVPVTEMQQESEAWAAKTMKMEFLGLHSPMAAADSLRMEGLSLRDSGFAAFLSGKVPGTAGTSEVQRCVQAVGADRARQAAGTMETMRQQAVASFLEQAGVPADRITFRPGTPEELAGHTGLPGYRFVVDVRP